MVKFFLKSITLKTSEMKKLVWSYLFHLGCYGGDRLQKNSTVKVHPKYVKCSGVQNANTAIAFLLGDAFNAFDQEVT